MRPLLPTVLKRLICQHECDCYRRINFRGVTFEEYRAMVANRKMQLCFYDSHGNFRVKTKKSTINLSNNVDTFNHKH